MAKSIGSRGPKRSRASKIKMVCAYRKCRRLVDVKNVGKTKTLKRKDVNLEQCRAVRKQCQAIRFCCSEHLKLCKAVQSVKRGGREPLSPDQCISLIQTLLVICPWAAVLSLLQLFIMDRADCSRKCCWEWLSGLDPRSQCQPSINIPKANGKTVARTIPLYQPFAEFLWKTAHGNPIQALTGETWPAAGQNLDSGPLFPGYSVNGKCRNWNKAISERAYLARLHQAAEILRAQRAVAKANQVEHVFDGYDLGRLGTHSWKKTSVTMFSDHEVSWAIIAAISGTSIQMLQRSYDIATQTRQHKAMMEVFGPALGPALLPEKATCEENHVQLKKYCGKCGVPRRYPDVFCTACGSKL